MTKTVKEMIEVMQAFDRGERIECTHRDNTRASWAVATAPCWDWWGFNYRVAPKPKKQIKMLCYLTKFRKLVWIDSERTPADSWTHVPSEDKIIEVDE